jgi:hypothetical protein
MFNNEQDYFKQFFSPLTTLKAIHIIVLVGIIVFGNALFNDFVANDKDFILLDPQTHYVNLAVTFGENSFNWDGQYRPLQPTYFSILYSLFGATPFPYHVLQILLHIIATILLYILFRKFLSAGIALFSALVFLIHPMQVESVSYIAQTASPLFFLLGIIPLLLTMSKNVSIKKFALAFFLILLSLLEKETGILFLFVMVVYSFLFARKQLFKLSIGGFITLVVYAYFRFYIGHIGFEKREDVIIAGLSLSERLLNVPMIMFHYIKTFFFPQVLQLQQHWAITSAHFSTFYLPLVADLAFLTGIFLIGFYIFKRHKQDIKPFLFFSAWFLSGLFFHLNIYPLDATFADRWFYFPMAGLLGMIGIGIQALCIRSSRVKHFAIIAAVIFIAILSLRTILRNANWSNENTLYSHDTQVGDDPTAEALMGDMLMKEGKKDVAIQHFEKAAELNPKLKSILWMFRWNGNHIRKY